MITIAIVVVLLLLLLLQQQQLLLLLLLLLAVAAAAAVVVVVVRRMMMIIIIVVVIIIIIIIIMALKGAVRDFTISLLRRELSPTRTLKWSGRYRVQITCDTSSAYHVQHVACYLVRRDSSVVKVDKFKMAFILALFYWVKTVTDGEREKTGVGAEKP